MCAFSNSTHSTIAKDKTYFSDANLVHEDLQLPHTDYHIIYFLYDRRGQIFPNILYLFLHNKRLTQHELIYINKFIFFFFNDPSTTAIYPLSLHDALPIFLEEHASDLHSLTNLVCRLLL